MDSNTLLNPVKRFVLTAMPEPALALLKKAYYARMLRRSSADDEPDMAVLPDVVASGDCVLDIGANIGVYTKRLSELVGATGKVISMEPVRTTFEILTSNVRTLKMDNVQCLNVAVSDHKALVSMEIPKYETGWQNIYRAHIVDKPGGTVQSISLDDICRDLGHVHFIKCDVEGHERAVLRGACNLIRTHHPKWLIEIDGDPDAEGSQASETFGMLTNFGYRAYVSAPDGLRAREPGMRAVNYFFL